MIRKTKHSDSSRGHPGIASFVRLRVDVGHAVDFDRKFGCRAVEISDEWAQRHLSAKLQSAKPMVAQLVPQLLFGWARIATHRPRVVEQRRSPG
jgi:hypothetical protein